MRDGRAVEGRITIGLALVCCSCAPLAAGERYFARATPVCELVFNEQNYAGQEVLVTGLYASTPHGAEIYTPGCSRSVKLHGSVKTPNDKHAARVMEAGLTRNEVARIPVVVSGVFQPVVRWENGERVIYANGPFIEQASIVAARQP
jgi:hypothetical protein